jgi:hypothetical protein
MDIIDMGYTTDFKGSISINPPLNAKEISFLKDFSESRRMARTLGPYYVGDETSDIINHNTPSEGQPGLWVPSDDGTVLEWDRNEKFYESAMWMKYLIDHFLKIDCAAKSQLVFLQANHVLNGTIEAQGEEYEDRWDLVVTDNAVTQSSYVMTKSGIQEI